MCAQTVYLVLRAYSNLWYDCIPKNESKWSDEERLIPNFAIDDAIYCSINKMHLTYWWYKINNKGLRIYFGQYIAFIQYKIWKQIIVDRFCSYHRVRFQEITRPFLGFLKGVTLRVLPRASIRPSEAIFGQNRPSLLDVEALW